VLVAFLLPRNGYFQVSAKFDFTLRLGMVRPEDPQPPGGIARSAPRTFTTTGVTRSGRPRRQESYRRSVPVTTISR
jgi:hypothetical protein